jgi:hypothetical protein
MVGLFQAVLPKSSGSDLSHTGSQCCRSESERIRTFLLDPNPKKCLDSDTDSDSDPDTVVE